MPTATKLRPRYKDIMWPIRLSFSNQTPETLTYSETAPSKAHLERFSLRPGQFKTIQTLVGYPWSIKRNAGIIAVYTPLKSLEPNELVEMTTYEMHWETVNPFLVKKFRKLWSSLCHFITKIRIMNLPMRRRLILPILAIIILKRRMGICGGRLSRIIKKSPNAS